MNEGSERHEPSKIQETPDGFLMEIDEKECCAYFAYVDWHAKKLSNRFSMPLLI